MADVEFEDNSVQVKNAIEKAAIEWLHEVAGELVSQTQRNSAVGKVAGGQTKGEWKCVVDTNKMKATVGNPQENAVWEEFGTGEYALKGDGRKGGWYILIGEGSKAISQSVVDAYGMKVVYGKDGKKYAFTRGKKPKRMLFKAFKKVKPKAQKALEAKLKGLK